MLPCHVTPTTTANISWLQTEKYSSGEYLYKIYINGRILQQVRDRFSVHNASVGDYTLKIENVQPSDAGLYRCFDQQRPLQNYFIDVSG